MNGHTTNRAVGAATRDPRVEARLRANLRLRRMTMATALAGLVATGGFGWIAAAGQLSQGTTDTGLTGSTTTAATDTTTGSTSSSTTTSRSTTTVTGGSGTAHASTGGS